jgi:DNA-binding Lrp family transcriptional regulator
MVRKTASFAIATFSAWQSILFSLMNTKRPTVTRGNHRSAERDEQILDLVRKGVVGDSAKEIARILNAPPNSIRKRLRKFRKDGILTTSVRTSSAFGCRALVSVDLNVTETKSRRFKIHHQHDLIDFMHNGLRKFKEFKPFMQNVIVEEVYPLLGGKSDICMMVVGKNDSAIYNFVTRVVHSLPFVTGTNTAMIPNTEKTKLKK